MPQGEHKFELDFLLDRDDESLLDELRRVASTLKAGQALTLEVYTRQSPKISQWTLRRRFGSWKQVLERAGLENLYIGPTTLSADEVIVELKRVHAIVGTEWLTTKDFNTHSVVEFGVVRRRFGTFAKGLREAGIPAHPLERGRGFSDEERFENLAEVWTHYGRAPHINEMAVAPSRFQVRTYTTRWGTWRKALKAFLEWANSDEAAFSVMEDGPAREQTASIATIAAPIKRTGLDSRNVPPKLRWRVIERDKFRCVACGRSPATHLNIELHADHIIAFVNGGKTTFENLQTLCRDCNLGKGAL